MAYSSRKPEIDCGDRRCSVFCNTYHTQSGIVVLPTHTINLSFERGSHEWFSAVRLIVVTDMDDPNESLICEQVIMTDWPRPLLDIERLFLSRNPTIIPSIRDRYLDHRQQIRQGLPSDKAGAVATIVLQLTQSVLPYVHPSKLYYVFTPYVHWAPVDLWGGPKGVKGDPIILYDRTLAVDAEHRSRFIKLTWGRIGDEDNLDLSMVRQHLGYHVQVLPLHPIQPPRQRTLPPCIIRSIVDYASHWVWNSAWTKTILSCALVNKSWLQVLDIFWERVKLGLSVPNIKGLIRSLELRPQNARYVTRFNMHHLPRIHPSSSSDLEEGNEIDLIASKAILPAFFRSATSLYAIAIPVSLFEVCKQELALLDHVQDFQLSRWFYKASDPRCTSPEIAISIPDVLRVTRGWKTLRTLRMQSWGPDDSGYLSTAQSTDLEAPGPVRYSLETLVICNVKIYGDDLLQIVSNSGRTLSSIFLNSITLPRCQLSAFLLQVCSCLEKLEIHDTSITPNSDSDEEPILDALISQLIRLKEVKISRPLIPIFTNNGIARKQSPIQGGILELCDYPSTAIQGTAGEMSLAKALEEGKWEEIRLRFTREDYAHYVLDGADMDEFQWQIAELQTIAERKGTLFTLLDLWL